MAGESQREPMNKPDPTVITTQIIDKEITHLRELLESKLEAVDTRLNERDRRYTERFDAQQLAVREAFDGAKAAVTAAFDSSEKAIQKAEVSIEKRADATYVAQQELSRALALLMPRAEVEARINAISDRMAELTLRQTEFAAVKTGGNEARIALYALAGFIATLLGIGTLLLAQSG